MRAKWLVGIVVLLGAVTFFVLKAGNDARQNDAASDFAQELAGAQLQFESCLFGEGGSQNLAAGAAEGLLGNSNLWQSCTGALVDAADLAQRNSRGSVTAIASYQRVLHEHQYELPGGDRKHPGDLCRAAATLRGAFTALRKPGQQEVNARPDCEPKKDPMEAVSGPDDDDEIVTIAQRDPGLVGRFRRPEGEALYAEYREGSWTALPLPPLAIDGSFEPQGPLAILRGSPQTVVRYEEGAWTKVGVGPKVGVLRHLRVTREQGLIALAEDFDAGQFYALRSASLSGPLGPPIKMADPSLPKGHHCAPPLLHADNTIAVACSLPSTADRELILLRIAASDALAERIAIARGDGEQPEILACTGSQQLWIRWGVPGGETRVFGSKDAGKSFDQVGRLPKGGTMVCRSEALLWLGFDGGDAQLAYCGLGEDSCSKPTKVGGDQAWLSLDGATLALASDEAAFAAIFDLSGAGPLHANAYALFPERRIGLRNLRKSGAVFFERVAQR